MRKTIPLYIAALLALLGAAGALAQPDDSVDLASLDMQPLIEPPERHAPPLVEPTTPEQEPSFGLTGDWFGQRKRLRDKGISVGSDLAVDFSHNLRGGLDTERTCARFLLDFHIAVETEPLLRWKGGTFFAAFQWQDGENGSGQFGDYQGISGIDADGRTQLAEIWFEQRLLDDKLKLRAGKIDANAIFGFSEHGGEFLNGGMGYLLADGLIPTYPDPAFGLALVYEPAESFYIGGGVFDGALAEGRTTGDEGPHSLFGAPADLYLIAEAGMRWQFGQLPGRLALGLTYGTGSFETFDGGMQSGSLCGYAVLDQQVWKEVTDAADDPQGLAMFVFLDLADPDVSELDYHLAAGLTWTGAIPRRDADVIGLGASWAHFSDDAGFADEGELAVESFYRLALSDYAAVKLDLQYIVDPGGAGLRDALIATVRLELGL